MMELIRFQRARHPHMSDLRNVLEQRLEQLAVEEEIPMLPEEECAERTNTAPPYFQNQIPEDMLLLLDTSILRKLCGEIDLGDVWKDLIKTLRRANGFWRSQPSTDGQRKVLLRCGLDVDLVNDLNKADASALISVIKKYEKPTVKQVALLRNRFGIVGDAVPKTAVEASDLIDKLFNKQGELPLWARQKRTVAPIPPPAAQGRYV